MSQAKRASKGKRPSKAVSVLGIAGASLASSTGGSLADIPVADIPSPPFQFITLGDEEISDVSLATFHLFDKEGLGAPRSGIIQLARGGCGCGHGCGGRFQRLRRLRTWLRRRFQRLRRLRTWRLQGLW
jgi:hypothetical protein